MDVQEARNEQLQELIQACQAVPAWDGRIRVGFPNAEQRKAMAGYSSRKDVQDQLALQHAEIGSPDPLM